MKNQKKQLKSRSYLVNLEPERDMLTLVISDTYVDGEQERYDQDFNLRVMPLEMAMQIVCTMINPPKSK